MKVQGMLKGFIDLVFEHQGVFYVVDYRQLSGRFAGGHQQEAMAQNDDRTSL